MHYDNDKANSRDQLKRPQHYKGRIKLHCSLPGITSSPSQVVLQRGESEANPSIDAKALLFRCALPIIQFEFWQVSMSEWNLWRRGCVCVFGMIQQRAWNHRAPRDTPFAKSLFTAPDAGSSSGMLRVCACYCVGGFSHVEAHRVLRGLSFRMLGNSAGKWGFALAWWGSTTQIKWSFRIVMLLSADSVHWEYFVLLIFMRGNYSIAHYVWMHSEEIRHSVNCQSQKLINELLQPSYVCV